MTKKDHSRKFIPVSVAVLTISDSRTEENDKSGALLVERVRNAGHQCADKQIVVDDIHQVRAQVCQWVVAPKIQVILTTGGTGVTGRDGTPEAISSFAGQRNQRIWRDVSGAIL